MKKRDKLVNKVKHLLKRANAPRWLHHKGPKFYEFWQHAFALFVKEHCQLSYRRTVALLKMLGFTVASKSTLCYQAQKIPHRIWKALLQLTVPDSVSVAAIDGSGLSRTNPSWHYATKIRHSNPANGFFNLSICIDVKRRKILSLRLRSKVCNDIRDAQYLFRNCVEKPKIMLADKGYDAEWLHEFFEEKGCKSIIPVRKGCRKGRLRKRMRDSFPQRLYNQRSLVESVFSAIKRKFGSSVCSRTHRAAVAQMYCRAILHNLTGYVWLFLGLSRGL